MDFYEEKIKVGQNMIRYGGSFAQALGQAIIVADAENANRILEAWPSLWNEYKDWGSNK